jgi:peptidoglycan/LPS O-acetylase OafA/YrhL
MKPRNRYDIQGLRSVAVILVILFHLPAAINLGGGFIGVDIFYVISGFVVTNMVLGTQTLPGHALRSMGQFLKRRVMRLVPALAVVVVATLILGILFAPTQELAQVSNAGLASETFVSNVFYARYFDTYWNPAVLRSPFLHTWSLGVEFQTYLLFPLLFVAVFKAGRATMRSLRSGLVVTLVLGAVSLAAFVYLLVVRSEPLSGFSPQALAFYTPVTRFWEFALGIVPAIVAWRGGWAMKSPARFVTPVAWVLIAAGLVGSTIDETLNLFVILACAGVAMLLANGERAVGARRSLLEWKPLVWIGDRSYSIYLWHWPLLVLSLWLFPGNIPVALASIGITVLLSMATYRFVEQRFRRSKSKSPVRALLPSAAFVLAGVLAAGLGLTVAATPAYITPTPLAAAASPLAESGMTAADMNGAIAGCTIEALQITCVNVPGAPTVVVIGDSLGYRALPAVQLAALEHGLNATMMWTGGCGIELDSCPQFVYDYLDSTDVAALVVAMNFDRASNRANAVELAGGEVAECSIDQPTSDCDLHIQNVKMFTERSVAGRAQLETYSDHILMALPFPQQEQSVVACLSVPLYQRLFAAPIDPHACGGTSLQWQHDRQGLYPEAITGVVSEDPDVTLWDPTDYLCEDGWCPAVVTGGEQIMSDGIHWTWEASRFLYPVFDEYLDTVTAKE